VGAEPKSPPPSSSGEGEGSGANCSLATSPHVPQLPDDEASPDQQRSPPPHSPARGAAVQGVVTAAAAAAAVSKPSSSRVDVQQPGQEHQMQRQRQQLARKHHCQHSPPLPAQPVAKSHKPVQPMPQPSPAAHKAPPRPMAPAQQNATASAVQGAVVRGPDGQVQQQQQQQEVVAVQPSVSAAGPATSILESAGSSPPPLAVADPQPAAAAPAHAAGVGEAAFSPASAPRGDHHHHLYGNPYQQFSPVGVGGFGAPPHPQQQHYQPLGLSPPLASLPGYLPHPHPGTSPGGGYGVPAGPGYDALQQWHEMGAMQPPPPPPPPQAEHHSWSSHYPLAAAAAAAAAAAYHHHQQQHPYHHVPSHLGPHGAVRNGGGGGGGGGGAAAAPPLSAAPLAVRPRQVPLGQQLLQHHGWRAAASNTSSGASSPLHPARLLDGVEGGVTATSEALDDAAAADTALSAAAGSLDDGWRPDARALFRSGSVGTLGGGVEGECGGECHGAGTKAALHCAGSLSAPGSAPDPTTAARMIPGSSNIWAYSQQSDGSLVGLGTSPVARVLFPRGRAAGAGFSALSSDGGGTSGASAAMHYHHNHSNSRPAATAQLLPSEGELLMAMAAPEGHDEGC